MNPKKHQPDDKYMSMFRTLILLMMLSALSLSWGCNAQQERADLKNSGVLLYPVVKASDMISGLGQALRHLSTPGAWNNTLDDQFVKAITSEQIQAHEQHGAIHVPRQYLNQKKGMGFGVEHLPDPLRPFVKMVEQIAGYQFNWFLHAKIKDMAMAMPNGVIFINPNRMDELSGEAQLLVALHEAAHHTLKHTESFGVSEIINAPTVPWVQPAKEMLSDRQAAMWMFAAGIQPHRIVFAASTLLGDRAGTSTHPAGQTRLDHIRLTLIEIQTTGTTQSSPQPETETPNDTESNPKTH